MVYWRAGAWYVLVAIAEALRFGAFASTGAPIEIGHAEGKRVDESADFIERVHIGQQQQHAWRFRPKTPVRRQPAAANITTSLAGLRVNSSDAPEAKAQPPPAAAGGTSLGAGLRVDNFTTPEAVGVPPPHRRNASSDAVAAAATSRKAGARCESQAGCDGGASSGAAIPKAADGTQKAAVEGSAALAAPAQRLEGERARGTQAAVATGRYGRFFFDARPKAPLGLPMIFWALLADAMAMLGFAACIPFVLTVAKRKKLPCN